MVRFKQIGHSGVNDRSSSTQVLPLRKDERCKNYYQPLYDGSKRFEMHVIDHRPFSEAGKIKLNRKNCRKKKLFLLGGKQLVGRFMARPIK